MAEDTKAEEASEASAELVEEVALTKQVLPFTMADLAAREDGGKILERGIQNYVTLRNASIALTEPQDWTLYKIDEAKIRGYLENVGVERVWSMWGPQQYDLTAPVRQDDQETGEFSISMTGSCLFRRTGISVEHVTATRYSYEEFIVKRKLPKLQIEPEVKRACRSSLNGKHGRILMGLNAVPTQELDEVWEKAGMKWKSTKLCNLGRGFGSQAERHGAAVQQSEIEAQYQPRCETCNNVMKFIPAGTTQQGKSYSAFWSCPSKDHKYTLKHEQALAEAKRMKTDSEKRQAGEE